MLAQFNPKFGRSFMFFVDEPEAYKNAISLVVFLVTTIL
jgi:hypothetical protein